MIGKANFFAKLIPFILIVFFTSPQSFAKSKCDEQLTLTIDNHAVNISLSKLEKHYTSAIERVRQVVENANLIFPSSPVMITIHPNFNF